MKHIDIQYIGGKLTHFQEQGQKEHFISKVESNQVVHVLDLWRRSLSVKLFDQQFVLLNLSVRYLTKYRPNQCYLIKTITPHEVQHLSLYLEQNKQIDDLAAVAYNLHFKVKSQALKTSHSLFKVLVMRFQHIQSDEVREQIIHLLTDLMCLNNEFVKYANQPYYFLQYLIFRINQEEKEDELVKWCELIKKIYLSPQAQSLFTESDFKALVDVIVRHIQNFSQESYLVCYLETYLVLSISPFIKSNGKYHKIEQILMVLSDLQNKSEQIQELAGEIASLKFQTM